MNMLDKDMARHQENPPMDLSPKRHPYWKRVHRDWKFWVVALLMLALMIFYTMSDNFALRGRGIQTQQPVPANVGP